MHVSEIFAYNKRVIEIMSKHILIKVYGHIWPSTVHLIQSLQPIVPYSEHMNLDEILEHDNDLTRISFEGIYFPLDDVLEVIKTFLQNDSQGKIDYIDLEEWTLTRHTITGKDISISQRSLNDVMDYSGH